MEKVYVENDWYDGPRKGIADFNGIPHRFVAHFDELKGYEDTFSLFPISSEEFELEIEQWKIYLEWNKKYEAGKVKVETHPGHSGLNQRWDEIEELLKNKREVIPGNAILANAEFGRINQENRYVLTGPCYGVVWKVIE
ncbi:hypothetical protein P886_1173 [Alteromonadaceae bacterium 2753L.S.0a.02]|nr:hypothetical protein P886_1173 [Alteromonadaceae bacterium 2753L.S.0a.02]